jgi:MFS transporter, FHS family, glucose/mannose:H+ symporter
MPKIKFESSQTFIIYLHIAFFLSGIATVIIGQVLPLLSTRFSLNDQQIAYLFPAQFAGSIIGTFLCNWLGKRNNFLLATLIGCFSMACGVLMFNSLSFEFCLVGFALNGFGIGLTLPSINMLILELKPLNATSSLNFLNVFWGIGAILSQPFVDILSRKTNIIFPTSVLAATLAIIGILIALLPKEVTAATTANADIIEVKSTPIWNNPIAWGIALFNFIHVGFESGIGGWLKTYSLRFDDGATALVQPITLFYIFFVIGRGIAPRLSISLNDNKILISGLFTILIGLIAMLFAPNLIVLWIGGIVSGLGTSAIFPTNLSRFTKIFGESSIKKTTPFFISGTLGATFTTWLIGYISNQFNDLRSGMFVLLGSILLLIVIQFILAKQKPVL